MSAPPQNLLVYVDELSSQFVVRALHGIRRAAEPSGWQVETREVKGLPVERRLALLRQDAASRLHGAVIYAHLYLTEEQAALLKAAGLVVGFFGGMLEGVNWVVDDGNEGAYLGAAHLAELGHRRVAHLSGDPQIVETRLREAGFQRGLRARGVKPEAELLVRLKDYSTQEGRDAATALLSRTQRPTAIFSTAGDTVAAGVYYAASKLGLRIPQDLSVLGYDDLPQAALMQPPLSSIRQPLEEMGVRLATELISAASSGSAHEPGQAMVRPELVLRGSTAAPGAK